MIKFIRLTRQHPTKLSVFSALFVIILMMTIFAGTLNKVAHAKYHFAHKPLIGILLNEGGSEEYSTYPWYVIRQNYGQVVSDFGGIPVFIGHDLKMLDDYLKILDGIVLTGGDFQSHEAVYSTGINAAPFQLHSREALEYALIKKAYAQDIPVLGICAGMQNMNVALGGTLIKSLKETLQSPIEHRNEKRQQFQHSISITAKTKLQQILGSLSLQVNSNHYEGVGRVPDILIVNARAPDGVIEGIESPHKRFFIGVMWHPEFLLTTPENKLWEGFIAAAEQYHQSRL